MLHLASVRFSVGGDFGGADGARAKSMASLTRFMEIGGMVFDWGFQPLGRVFSNNTPGFMGLFHEAAIVTDRLDAAGVPASLDFEQLASQTPVVIATANSLFNVEQNYPTRIHWRRTEQHDLSTVNVRGDNPDEGEIRFYSQRQSYVRDQRRTENLRLKLRLEDDQGLFFRSAFRTDSAWPDGTLASFRFWVAGSIFYRVRV